MLFMDTPNQVMPSIINDKNNALGPLVADQKSVFAVNKKALSIYKITPEENKVIVDMKEHTLKQDSEKFMCKTTDGIFVACFRNLCKFSKDGKKLYRRVFAGSSETEFGSCVETDKNNVVFINTKTSSITKLNIKSGNKTDLKHNVSGFDLLTFDKKNNLLYQFDNNEESIFAYYLSSSSLMKDQSRTIRHCGRIEFIDITTRGELVIADDNTVTISDVFGRRPLIEKTFDKIVGLSISFPYLWISHEVFRSEENHVDCYEVPDKHLLPHLS